MRISLHSTSLNFLSIIPILGAQLFFFLLLQLPEGIHSWHEHDALEIQHFVDKCIEGTVNSLEASGWAKESIRVIGMISRTATCIF